MKKFGVGIIGTGSIANGCHAPAVTALDQTSLVAVLSRDISRGQDFLQRHGADNAVVHTTLESFAVDPRIDVVIICSPDRLHPKQATVCLKNGKHVLIEKPMAVNAEDALSLVELANANNLTLATGFHLRSHVGHRALYKRIVEQGEIGTLRHIRAIWAFPQDNSNWRAQEDLAKWWSLSAVGAHCIDLTRWFANDKSDWRQFSSVISNEVWNGPHDETVVIAGQFAKGPTVEIISSVQFGPYNRLELFGEKGQAICDGTMGRDGAGTIQLNDNQIVFKPVSPFIKELEDFVTCIVEKRKPRANGSVGLRSVQDLLLAYDK